MLAVTRSRMQSGPVKKASVSGFHWRNVLQHRDIKLDGGPLTWYWNIMVSGFCLLFFTFAHTVLQYSLLFFLSAVKKNKKTKPPDRTMALFLWHYNKASDNAIVSWGRHTTRHSAPLIAFQLLRFHTAAVVIKITFFFSPPFLAAMKDIQCWAAASPFCMHLTLQQNTLFIQGQTERFIRSAFGGGFSAETGAAPTLFTI